MSRRMLVLPVIVVTLGLGLGGATAVQAQGRGYGRNQNNNMRFAEMDRNRDGRITRAEWNGSDQSFRMHDWNNDGILSGNEVKIDGQRPSRPQDFDSPYLDYRFSDWTSRGFSNLDHNRDNRITSDEWHFDREMFWRVDHNRDGVLSRAEFLSQDRIDDDRDDSFVDLDRNHDNRLARDEWLGTFVEFDRLDQNNDNYLSRREAGADTLSSAGTPASEDLFSSLDVNHDRVISRNEWHWNTSDFDQRDVNRDRRLTRDEFFGRSSGIPTLTQAYRAGFERGQLEGRAAGLEDHDRHQEWDIEGQREMQAADSGYTSSLGPRPEYQAGYRDGFRRAYPDGFRGQ